MDSPGICAGRGGEGDKVCSTFATPEMENEGPEAAEGFR